MQTDAVRAMASNPCIRTVYIGLPKCHTPHCKEQKGNKDRPFRLGVLCGEALTVHTPILSLPVTMSSFGSEWDVEKEATLARWQNLSQLLDAKEPGESKIDECKKHEPHPKHEEDRKKSLNFVNKVEAISQIDGQ